MGLARSRRPRRLGVDQQRLGGDSAASRRSRRRLVGRAVARAIFFRPRAIEAAAREDYLAPGRFPLADPAPARRRAPKGSFTRRRCSSPPALVILTRPRSSKPVLLLPRLDLLPAGAARPRLLAWKLLPAGAARLQSSKVSSLPSPARSPPLHCSFPSPAFFPARLPSLLIPLRQQAAAPLLSSPCGRGLPCFPPPAGAHRGRRSGAPSGTASSTGPMS